MKRRLSLLALALAACGPKAEVGKLQPGKGGAEPVTLVFRHGNVPGYERYFHHLFQEFTKRNPGIRIENEILPNDTGQQHQLYAINLEGGTDAFDVLAMDIIWNAEFARAGWVLELSRFFDEAQRKAFLPSTVEAATFRGAPYAVPWFTDSGLLYYRKDLLAKHGHKPPETWDELVRIAQDVVKKEGDPRLVGYVWQGKQYEGMVCDAVEVLGSAGVRFLDEKGRWAVQDDKAAGALRFMSDLIHKHGVSPMLVLAADEETARHIFGNGEAVFMRNWPYAWGLFDKPDSAVRGKVGLAPLPRFEGGRHVGTLGGWFLGINAGTRHPAEAYKFVEYMTSEEVQRKLFDTLSYLPTRSAIYEDAEFQHAHPQLGAFGKILLQTQPRPVTPYYTGVSEILQGEFSAALAGLKTPEQALASVRLQLEPVLGVSK